LAHVYELRRRGFYVALSVGLWAVVAYNLQRPIVAGLLRPAADQEFVYTTVGGGVDFLLRVCIYSGLVMSFPLFIFQILQFLRPLLIRDAFRFIVWCSVASGVLALGGVAFGYLVGLPAGLHFLLHEFSTSDKIQAMLSINSYLSFVSLYLFGSALLFQLPLILIIINRIKPLSPRRLLSLKYQRWVILVSCAVGGIMNPSPRLQDLLLLAVPMIVAYQVGAVMVWLVNRRGGKFARLLQQDAVLRAERQARFAAARAELIERRRARVALPVSASAVPAPQSSPPRAATIKVQEAAEEPA
jgi:sec-independent protein translocase protein TatC